MWQVLAVLLCLLMGGGVPPSCPNKGGTPSSPDGGTMGYPCWPDGVLPHWLDWGTPLSAGLVPPPIGQLGEPPPISQMGIPLLAV